MHATSLMCRLTPAGESTVVLRGINCSLWVEHIRVIFVQLALSPMLQELQRMGTQSTPADGPAGGVKDGGLAGEH